MTTQTKSPGARVQKMLDETAKILTYTTLEPISQYIATYAAKNLCTESARAGMAVALVAAMLTFLDAGGRIAFIDPKEDESNG